MLSGTATCWKRRRNKGWCSGVVFGRGACLLGTMEDCIPFRVPTGFDEN